MNKKTLIPLIFIITLILAVAGTVLLAEKSGLTINATASNTFGEKSISIDAINVLNNSTMDTYEYNGTTYTYLEGYVQNNNKYDALHVKMNATAYDQYGNVFANNRTVHINSGNIPAEGVSYFYVIYPDPDKKITRIEVNVIDARAKL